MAGITNCCPSVLWHSLLGHLTCKIVVSSMYLWVKHDSFSLSIKMTNVRGPSHDPLGMPPFKTSHMERVLVILTRCCLLVRKDANHFITEPRIASSIRLLMTTVWSTRSKAFEKSTNVTLAWRLQTDLQLYATCATCQQQREWWTDLWWLRTD